MMNTNATKNISKTIRVGSVKAIVIASLSLACLPITYAQTLKEAVQTVLETNPDILASGYARRAADARVSQARAGYLPKADIELVGGIGEFDNSRTNYESESVVIRKGEFTASQMLFDGFRTKNQVDRARSDVESAAYNVIDTSEGIALQVVDEYINVIRTRELVDISKENYEAIKEIYSLIEQRSGAGLSSRVDKKQADARLAQAEAALSDAQKDLNDANTRFERVVGTPPEELDNEIDYICCEDFPGNLADAIKTGYSQDPELKSAIAQHEAALSRVNESYSGFSPTITAEIEAEHGYGDSGIDEVRTRLLAILRARYNVFRGGRDLRAIEENKHRADARYEEAKSVMRQIEYDIRISWNGLEVNQALLPDLESYANSADNTRKAYREQFQLGQRTLLDLLDTENEYFTAKRDYINAQYDVTFSKFKLIASMGDLLGQLDIQHREEASFSN